MTCPAMVVTALREGGVCTGTIEMHVCGHKERQLEKEFFVHTHFSHPASRLCSFVPVSFTSQFLFNILWKADSPSNLASLLSSPLTSLRTTGR